MTTPIDAIRAPRTAGVYEQSDGEFTLRAYAYWDYRHFPPKLVHPDFQTEKVKCLTPYPR